MSWAHDIRELALPLGYQYENSVHVKLTLNTVLKSYTLLK